MMDGSMNLEQRLQADRLPGTAWYAVLDAAQDRYGPARARESGLRIESLFAGRLGELAEPAAPHLVALEFDNPFSAWLLAPARRHHAVLLRSRCRFEDVHKHLRRFLLARDHAGKKYRFRFYDPRVLRAFLPVCTPEELAQFFGPVERFYAATRDSRGMLCFRLDRGQLRACRIEVDAPDAAAANG